VAGRVRSIEKIYLIGTRSRDLPACSIVLQLRYRTPPYGIIVTKIFRKRGKIEIFKNYRGKYRDFHEDIKSTLTV
jgi:hypothetical protein